MENYVESVGNFREVYAALHKKPDGLGPSVLLRAKSGEGGQRLAEKGRISFWMRVGGRADLSVLALF